MPCRCRLFLVAFTFAAFLPSTTTAIRTLESSQHNLTSDFAPAEYVPDGLKEAWDTFNNYAGHDYVMTFVDVWTLYSNMKKVATVQGQKRTATKFQITGEIFTSLEALYEVDSTFGKVLGIELNGTSSWNCSQYKKAPPELSFTRKGFLLFPIDSFEYINEAQCLKVVENHINAVRWGICWLENLAEKWAQETKKATQKPAFFGDLYNFDSAKVCSGAHMDQELLSEDMKAMLDEGAAEANETCIMDKDGNLRQQDCATECAQHEECTAVTHESKHGRRCCFYSGPIDEVDAKPSFISRWFGRKKVHADEKCLVFTGRDRFLMKSVEDVSDWLEKNGFKHVKDQAASFGGAGLNGMSLSFLTEPMLRRYLSSEGAPLKDAQVLRCRIDAELQNDPERDCSPRRSVYELITGLSPISRDTFDNSLIVPKGSKGKYYSIKWAFDFGRRFSPQKDVKAWSSGFYEVVSATTNVQKVYDIAQKGVDGLTALVMLKAVTSTSGLMKFREATSFNSCDNVRWHLDLVVEQLMSVPMNLATQQKHVKAYVNAGK